jgi:hypothetical protein
VTLTYCWSWTPFCFVGVSDTIFVFEEFLSFRRGLDLFGQHQEAINQSHPQLLRIIPYQLHRLSFVLRRSVSPPLHLCLTIQLKESMSSTPTTPTLMPEDSLDARFGFDVNDDMPVIIFQDSQDGEYPSQKYGHKLSAPVFVGFIVVSAFIMWAFVACARCHDKRSRPPSQEGRGYIFLLLFLVLPASNSSYYIAESNEQRHEELKNKLESKPWGSTQQQQDSTEPTDRTFSRDFSSGDFSSENCSSISREESSAHSLDDEEENQNVPENSLFFKNGLICTICNKHFEFGEAVYESNNPQCGHTHHKLCMDKWLQYQNSCPVCNQPYVVQSNEV